MQVEEYIFFASALNDNSEGELALAVLEDGLKEFPESDRLWAFKSAVAGGYNFSCMKNNIRRHSARIFEDKNELFSIEYDDAASVSKDKARDCLVAAIANGQVGHEVIFSKIKSVMERCFPDCRPLLEAIPPLKALEYYLAMLQLYGHLEDYDKELSLLRGLIEVFEQNKVDHEVSRSIRSRYHALQKKIAKRIVHPEGDNQKANEKLRVALCISGQFRVHLEALKKTIDALRASCGCDVYIASWASSHDIIPPDIFDSGWRPKVFARSLPNGFSSRVLTLRSKVFFKKFPSLAGFARHYKEPEEISIEDIRNVLQPQDVVISNEQRFTESVMNRHNPGSVDELNQYKMYFNIKACNDLKRRYERKHGFKYDLVVRMRPDSFLVGKFDPRDYPLEPGNFYVNYLNIGRMADAIGIACSETMDHYADLWSLMSRGIRTVDIQGFRRRVHPHTIIFDHMWLNGYNLVYKTFPFGPLELPEDISAKDLLPGILADVSRRLRISCDDFRDVEALIKDYARECSGDSGEFITTLAGLAESVTRKELADMLLMFIAAAEDKFPAKVFSSGSKDSDSPDSYGSLSVEELELCIRRSLSETFSTVDEIFPYIQYLGECGKPEISRLAITAVEVLKSKGQVEKASRILHYVASVSAM